MHFAGSLSALLVYGLGRDDVDLSSPLGVSLLAGAARGESGEVEVDDAGLVRVARPSARLVADRDRRRDGGE